MKPRERAKDRREIVTGRGTWQDLLIDHDESSPIVTKRETDGTTLDIDAHTERMTRDQGETPATLTEGGIVP